MRSICLAALLVGCADRVAPEGAFFEDVAQAAGLAFERVSAEGYVTVPDRIGGGVCVIDADGRAPFDLFFAVRPSESPGGSRLFVAHGAWSYADETSQRGLDDAGDAIGCLAFDADGDGDDDLFVTGVGEVRFFTQEGEAFVDRSASLDVRIPSTHMLSSAAAIDLDGDADLDVVVGGFLDLASVQEGTCAGVACSLYLANSLPAPSYALRRTDRGYVDATAELAPELGLIEPTLVLAGPDVDGDGAIDLYAGNDFGARFFDRVLVRESDGVWRDAAERTGLAFDAGGNGVDTMGFTGGDIDGDGDFDYATTAFAGFHSPLFVCDGRCDDRGRDLGMRPAATSFRWGNAMSDFDLDGDVDLFEATGHLVTEEEGRTQGMTIEHAQRPNFFVNDGTGRFTLVEDAISQRWPARGIAIADLDDDGRVDVVLGTTQGPPAVLRNVRTGGHFLRVRLRGRAPNTGAIGALVLVHSADRTRVRRRLAGEGFLGNFDPRLLFGLPSAENVRVDVVWPSGRTSSFDGIEVDRQLDIEEP